MPNHVKNRIVFEDHRAFSVEERITRKGHVDFTTLIPVPVNIYRGDLSRREEQDFGKGMCWYDWSIENWGTKWNAYETRLDIRVGSPSTIEFRTAWTPPFKFIVAFANVFDMKFRHSYCCEGQQIIGSDEWDGKTRVSVARGAQLSPEDTRALFVSMWPELAEIDEKEGGNK